MTDRKHIIINDRVFRIILFTAAMVVIITGVIYSSRFITIMMMAFFISIISAHPVSWLDKKNVPHVLSVIIVLLGILLMISGLSSIIGTSVTSFTSHLGKYESRLQGILVSINQELHHQGFNLSTEKFTQLFDPGKILDFTASTLSQLGNLMSNATIIFFIVLFVLLEMNSIALKWKVFGASSTGKTLTNLSRIEISVRHYLVIKTLTSLLTGVFVGAFLAILGVEYAILWGLIAFLLNFIPNIGSIIAAIPAILFAWIQLGVFALVWTTIIFLVVNLLIGYFIEPRVMGRGMGLSTLVVLLSLIIWGYLLGIIGMFFSVPLTMTLKIILEQNENTRPLAALLGTDEDARKLIEQQNIKIPE